MHLFLILLASTGNPIGISMLYRVNLGERTGYTGTAIFDRDNLRKGMGFASKLLLLKYAFNQLGLSKVYSEITPGDTRLIGGLRALGYRPLSPDAPREIVGEKGEHEIFELSRAAWESARSIMTAN